MRMPWRMHVESAKSGHCDQLVIPVIGKGRGSRGLKVG